VEATEAARHPQRRSGRALGASVLRCSMAKRYEVEAGRPQKPTPIIKCIEGTGAGD
jgi:hypothetical protein